MTETPKPQIWVPELPGLQPAVADKTQRVALRFGPDYRNANAYQTLLYRSVMGLVDARPATPQDAARELGGAPGQMIYHLHWEEHDMKGVPPEAARQAAQSLLDGLDRFAGAGGRIVWTRHNARPHDAHCADTHAELVAALTERADVIHCHSWEAFDHLAQTGPVDPAKTAVIAHGNYAGYYPCWPRQKARESFGFAAQDHVFLLFGRLAGYKQLPQTVAHFLQRPDAHIRLLIAGTDPDGVLPTLPADPRLSLHGGFVSDADLGRYFAAADTALLPYAASLSSGLAVMAAGFGLGILGSDTPGLRDIVRPGRTGLLFDTDTPQGLTTALDRAVELGQAQWRQFGQAAAQVAARRDWTGIGRLWAGLFCSLAHERKRFDPADARITPV